MFYTNPQVQFSTAMLDESEIALFPIKPIRKLEDRKMISQLNLPENEYVFGIVDLPPLVSNRLRYFQHYGKTFHMKNQPLEFSIMVQDCDPTEYWNELMRYIQKNSYPHIWILAYEPVCIELMKNDISRKGHIYYHDPSIQIQRDDFLLTETRDMIVKTYRLYEKNYKLN